MLGKGGWLRFQSNLSRTSLLDVVEVVHKIRHGLHVDRAQACSQDSKRLICTSFRNRLGSSVSKCIFELSNSFSGDIIVHPNLVFSATGPPGKPTRGDSVVLMVA